MWIPVVPTQEHGKAPILGVGGLGFDEVFQPGTHVGANWNSAGPCRTDARHGYASVLRCLGRPEIGRHLVLLDVEWPQIRNAGLDSECAAQESFSVDGVFDVRVAHGKGSGWG